MCGRFALYASPDKVRAAFGAADVGPFPARYNIAPTQPIAVIHTARGVRHFDLMRWGLVPRWVDDPRRFQLLINARAETVEERPAFRDAVRYRRCLIPASGYYDWNNGDREPRFIRPRGGDLVRSPACMKPGPTGNLVATLTRRASSLSPRMRPAPPLAGCPSWSRRRILASG